MSKFLKKRFLLTGPKISVTNTPTVTTQKFRSRTILFGHLRVFPKKLCVSVCFQKKMTQTSCPDQRTRLKTRPCGDVGGSGYDPIFYYRAITRTPGTSRGLELGTRGRSGAHTCLVG